MNRLRKFEEMQEVILLSHNELKFRESFFILYQAKWKKKKNNQPPHLQNFQMTNLPFL